MLYCGHKKVHHTKMWCTDNCNIPPQVNIFIIMWISIFYQVLNEIRYKEQLGNCKNAERIRLEI